MKFSFVILYFNRYEYILRIVSDIAALETDDIEIIIVDNNSDINIENDVRSIREGVKYIRLDSNLGAVARNRGIQLATGDYVISLDDDVVGINDADILTIRNVFKNERIAAISFKVIDPVTSKITNWIHHYSKDLFSDKMFLTNEVSEGAVCFRKSALDKVGLYYEKYFISHEGPDLACRILDADYDIVYCPDVVVTHHHSKIGRKSWRRYYYDTRNVFWLGARNYPLFFALKLIFWGVMPMLVYSIRDGFIKYWIKGVFDGIRELPEVIRGRRVVSQVTLDLIKEIESNRPSLFVLIKTRLFQKDVKI